MSDYWGCYLLDIKGFVEWVEAVHGPPTDMICGGYCACTPGTGLPASLWEYLDANNLGLVEVLHPSDNMENDRVLQHPRALWGEQEGALAVVSKTHLVLVTAGEVLFRTTELAPTFDKESLFTSLPPELEGFRHTTPSLVSCTWDDYVYRSSVGLDTPHKTVTRF